MKVLNRNTARVGAVVSFASIGMEIATKKIAKVERFSKRAIRVIFTDNTEILI